MARSVVGVFRDYNNAEAAVADLTAKGWSRDDISIVAADRTGVGGLVAAQPDGEAESRRASEGAGKGAVLGGVAGLAAGLAALAIPGIGPILAAGPLAAALTGAGVGAATGGIVGALTQLDISKEHALSYAEAVERGGTLVVVRADEDRADELSSLLSRHGANEAGSTAASPRSTEAAAHDPHSDAPTFGDEGSASDWGKSTPNLRDRG